MEITTRPLNRDEYLAGIMATERFYAALGVRHVFVAYGWGCDCPDGELYQDRPITLADLRQFIADAEAADYYRVSKDNLHVKEETGRSQFLFCHEADIHFTTDDEKLIEEVDSIWSAEGFRRERR